MTQRILHQRDTIMQPLMRLYNCQRRRIPRHPPIMPAAQQIRQRKIYWGICHQVSDGKFNVYCCSFVINHYTTNNINYIHTKKKENTNNCSSHLLAFHMQQSFTYVRLLLNVSVLFFFFFKFCSRKFYVSMLLFVCLI